MCLRLGRHRELCHTRDQEKGEKRRKRAGREGGVWELGALGKRDECPAPGRLAGGEAAGPAGRTKDEVLPHSRRNKGRGDGKENGEEEEGGVVWGKTDQGGQGGHEACCCLE